MDFAELGIGKYVLPNFPQVRIILELLLEKTGCWTSTQSQRMRKSSGEEVRGCMPAKYRGDCSRRAIWETGVGKSLSGENKVHSG